MKALCFVYRIEILILVLIAAGCGERGATPMTASLPRDAATLSDHTHFRTLVTFSGGTDGGNPEGDLIRDNAGNLFGTTSFGGDLSCGQITAGCGVVFKLDPAGHEDVLHRFHAGKGDGQFPWDLVMDSGGNLFGNANAGGTFNFGALFKIDPSGTESILFNFAGGSDGAIPFEGLALDASGNIYGVTFKGGNSSCRDNYGAGCGVVFSVSKTGKERILYRFKGGADGGIPWGGLLRDEAGTLYGTTANGGDLRCQDGTHAGCGVVYKLSTHGTETVLHKFTGGPDGGGPRAGLVMDEAGDLYGTTYYGGDLSCKITYTGCGVVFRIDPTGHETVLYKFKSAPDGAYPQSNIVIDASGNLFGLTTWGGIAICPQQRLPTCGTIFMLAGDGKESILHRFTGGLDGDTPSAGLLRDPSGSMFGTTFSGSSTAGAVFEIAR